MAITCTIDETGIHVPVYADVLEYLKEAFRGIYGSDIYIEEDSQDGQFLAIVAQAIHDCNTSLADVFNSFSPSKGMGAGLSSNVKLNGIKRKIPTYSTVDQLLVGQVGTVIENGYVSDSNGHKWYLPTSVVIPITGQITVTATCATAGAINAAVGDVSIIGTPTRGWQSATNLFVASPGNPVETNAELRRRQAKSTMIPSQTVLDGLRGSILAITDVTDCEIVENDTGATVGGISPHAIAVIAKGGSASAIADVIYKKKAPGTILEGTTVEDVDTGYGYTKSIRFYRPTDTPVVVEVDITPLRGYTTLVGASIQSAVATYINALTPGDTLYVKRLYTPANQDGTTNGATYKINHIYVAKGSDTPIDQDLVFNYWEEISCVPDNVVITGV